MLLAEPQTYLDALSKEPLRILELGSGTGVGGIAACRACELLQMEAEVHFTDYDETTLSTLQSNIHSNYVGPSKIRQIIRKLDWRDYLDAANVVEQAFDVVIGADIIYEREHGQLVCGVIQKLLRKDGVFHLVIPLRHTHLADVAAFENELQMHGLQVSETQELEKGEGQYSHRYYRIGWQSKN